jgi:hypothetical protein
MILAFGAIPMKLRVQREQVDIAPFPAKIPAT